MEAKRQQVVLVKVQSVLHNGVAVVLIFGPTPTSYAYKMPKKMRRLALRSALSFKAQENGLTVVDAFNFEAPKTKEFKNVLSTLEQPKKVLDQLKTKM